MSSSADKSSERFDWSAFTERTTGPEVADLLSPAQELSAALQGVQKSLQAAREEGRTVVDDVLKAAAAQAALVFQLGVVVARNTDALQEAGLGKVTRQLDVLRKQMTRALEKFELVVDDPVGRPFNDAEAHVDVVDWRRGAEFTDEVVAETIEPIVLHNGSVIRSGRVIMGAPADNEERA
ncbi:MAG TPA: hypothetical protein VJ914_01555 [Pseudonocardiaceae bacterium]|nr:hypothetical protein [Pseudonocardiaceae bacterium]